MPSISVLTSTIADISTASSTFVPVPDGGKVIKIITALQGAIGTANGGITFEIGGTVAACASEQGSGPC